MYRVVKVFAKSSVFLHERFCVPNGENRTQAINIGRVGGHLLPIVIIHELKSKRWNTLPNTFPGVLEMCLGKNV
jgi:hypothetical protein